MLTSNVNSGNSAACISELDSLPREYASEYHYLFKLVYEAANSEEGARSQQNYYFPNIARKLLETFLAFCYLSESGKLYKQLDFVKFEGIKKNKIYRFPQTYSHADQISDPGTRSIYSD